MEIQLIETSKGTVEVSFSGKGHPVLFIHGGHSNCRETLFHKGFDKKKFTLITPSRQGYGKTLLKGNASPRQTADLFVALLDKLNIHNVIIVGISAGGPTAIELAANYPQRVKKLILISAVTGKWLTKEDPNYRKGKKLFAPKVEKYSWMLFRRLYSAFPRRMAKLMYKELSTCRPINIQAGEIEELKTMIHQQRSFNGFVNDLDQTIEQGVLEQVKCPTLLLHSLYDKTVGAEHATTANAKIKGSILKTYKNKWGHLLWLGKESEIPIKDVMGFINNEGNAST